MKTSKVILLICSLTILFVLGIADGGDRLTEVMCDATTYEDIKKSRPPADSELLTDLFFNEYPLAYDKESRTFFYSVVEQDNDAFDPVIQFNSATKNARIAFRKTEFSEEAIRNNETCDFLVYSEDNFSEYHLVLTTLPILTIDLEGPVLDPKLPIRKEPIDGRITLFDNSVGATHSQRLVKSDAILHNRGHSSRMYPKKSYRFALVTESLGGHQRPNHVSLLGLRQDDDWILYSPYNDPEKVRNPLSTNLWYAFGAGNNSFGIMDGTQGKYVELLIDGRYWGLHFLMQPVDAKQVCLDESEDPTKSEFLYRSFLAGKTTTKEFYDAAAEVVAGTYELKAPDIPMNTYLKWAPIDAYEQLLLADDDVFMDRITSAIDMDNAIDMWLFLDITLAADNSDKNISYIAKRRDEQYIMLFSPWDLDLSWGNVWTDEGRWQTGIQLAPDTPSRGFLPIDRCLELGMEGLAERIQKRYAQLRSTILSDAAIRDMLQRYEQDIYGSGASIRDNIRWPNAAYADDFDSYESFVWERIAYVDAHIASLTGEKQ